jgi:hypothetical protein
MVQNLQDVNRKRSNDRVTHSLVGGPYWHIPSLGGHRDSCFWIADFRPFSELLRSSTSLCPFDWMKAYDADLLLIPLLQPSPRVLAAGVGL